MNGSNSAERQNLPFVMSTKVPLLKHQASRHPMGLHQYCTLVHRPQTDKSIDSDTLTGWYTLMASNTKAFHTKSPNTRNIELGKKPREFSAFGVEQPKTHKVLAHQNVWALKTELYWPAKCIWQFTFNAAQWAMHIYIHDFTSSQDLWQICSNPPKTIKSEKCKTAQDKIR